VGIFVDKSYNSNLKFCFEKEYSILAVEVYFFRHKYTMVVAYCPSKKLCVEFILDLGIVINSVKDTKTMVNILKCCFFCERQYGCREMSGLDAAAFDVSLLQRAMDDNHTAQGLFLDLKKASDMEWKS